MFLASHGGAETADRVYACPGSITSQISGGFAAWLRLLVGRKELYVESLSVKWESSISNTLIASGTFQQGWSNSAWLNHSNSLAHGPARISRNAHTLLRVLQGDMPSRLLLVYSLSRGSQG